MNQDKDLKVVEESQIVVEIQNEQKVQETADQTDDEDNIEQLKRLVETRTKAQGQAAVG